jgi:hypothetical protein
MLLVVVSIMMPGQSVAADSECVQNPRRVKACPHLLYRIMQLPDQTAPALRCICVEDFQPFIQQPSSEVAQVRQRMDRSQLEAELGMELEPILRILRRED